jgi:hypothetical protein
MGKMVQVSGTEKKLKLYVRPKLNFYKISKNLLFGDAQFLLNSGQTSQKPF